MESFNLAQLTKEMVVGAIRNMADPSLVGAGVVRSTLLARLKGRAHSSDEVHQAVFEVCRGAAMGLLLMECPLPRGAAAVLGMAHAAAKELGLDRDLVSVAALSGLADLRRFVPAEALPEIRARLDSVRPGAGDYFARFCGDGGAQQSHPAYRPPA